MKTFAQSITVSIAIYTTLFLLIASIAFGAEKPKKELSSAEVTLKEFVFEEEEYIDDIPFNTEAIAANYFYAKSISVEYDFEDEEYVNDIPFDTHVIAENYKNEKNLKNIFDFDEEIYVDDIPFNTEKIASEVFFIYYYKK